MAKKWNLVEKLFYLISRVFWPLCSILASAGSSITPIKLFCPFFIGMVHLSTKFTKDMLPYWYKRMYDGDPGTFKRGRAGQSIVYKHQDVFILGHLERDRYQPVLNISVMPWSTKNLAPSIWHQLYLQTVREREAQPYNKGGSAWSKPGPILVTVLVTILVFNSLCFVI